MARRYRKRRFRRRRKRTFVHRSPIARKMVTKLRYAEQVDLNPTAGVVAGHIFSANGLYDPNIAVGGHQPRGFDQLMALYDHFVVLGAYITVNYDNTGNAGNALVGIAMRDSATADTDINDYMETGRVIQKYAGGSGAPSTTVRMKGNPNKFLGRSKPLADSQLKGSASANPTEQVYFHIFAGDTDGLTNLNAIHCSVIIDYIVAFIEPKNPAQS